MHLICLGVVKKLIFHVIKSISENLSALRDHIPVEFARKPRSLIESNRWKATELRQFLLYTGPVVLKYKLPDNLYLNFLTLSIAGSIMLCKKYYTELLNYAQVTVLDTSKNLPDLKGYHFEGPLVLDISGEQYKQIILKEYMLSTSVGNNVCKLRDGTIAVITNFVKSDGSVKIIGKKFTKVQDFFTKPCPSYSIDVVYVSDLSDLMFWNLPDIVMKCIMLPYSNGFVV